MHALRDKPEEDAFYEVYDLAPDRSVGTVLPAILETRLSAVLTAAMVRDPDIWNDLFHSSGPLGPFGVKNRLAYMLGLFDKMIYRDFAKIIRVRNEFTHNFSVHKFEDSPIKDWVNSLEILPTLATMRDEVTGSSLKDSVMVDILTDSLSSPREKFKISVRVYLGKLVMIEDGVLAARNRGPDSPRSTSSF